MISTHHNSARIEKEQESGRLPLLDHTSVPVKKSITCLTYMLLYRLAVTYRLQCCQGCLVLYMYAIFDVSETKVGEADYDFVTEAD